MNADIVYELCRFLGHDGLVLRLVWKDVWCLDYVRQMVNTDVTSLNKEDAATYIKMAEFFEIFNKEIVYVAMHNYDLITRDIFLYLNDIMPDIRVPAHIKDTVDKVVLSTLLTHDTNIIHAKIDHKQYHTVKMCMEWFELFQVPDEARDELVKRFIQHAPKKYINGLISNYDVWLDGCLPAIKNAIMQFYDKDSPEYVACLDAESYLNWKIEHPGVETKPRLRKWKGVDTLSMRIDGHTKKQTRKLCGLYAYSDPDWIMKYHPYTCNKSRYARKYARVSEDHVCVMKNPCDDVHYFLNKGRTVDAFFRLFCGFDRIDFRVQMNGEMIGKMMDVVASCKFGSFMNADN